MNLTEYYIYRGKNVHCHRPVIQLMVDLEQWVDTPSCDIPGFTEKLVGFLPGLSKHKCSVGYEGGFIERLKEGTYLAHIIEHTALEIQDMLGYPVKFGKTRQSGNKTVYSIVYSYVNETVGLESGKLAFELIKSIVCSYEISFEAKLQHIRETSVKKGLGTSTQAIKEEAEKRGIPVIRIGNGSLLQLGYGKNQRRIQATLPESTSCIAVDIASDKTLTKEILHEYGIPVPEGRVATSLEEVQRASAIIGYPVVVKPNNGNQGKGVSVNLKTPEEVKEAYEIASQYESTVMVEKFIEGNHYRLLVVGNNIAAASQRIAASVTGDGIHTIGELIELENKNPIRGSGHEKPLTRIIVDEVVLSHLSRQNINLNHIPTPGQTVSLRENDNLSTGGTAVDVTDLVHPDNVRYAIKAAELIGLDVAGIDITTPDISIPLDKQGGAVIEINAAPGIRMHHYPTQGLARNVAKSIVDWLCPLPIDYSIPIVSVTGTNGKTTTTRMIAHIISEQGYNVGMSNTSGTYLGKTVLQKGDNTGPQSAETILMDKSVEYAVLETARGGIVKRGLGYTEADVGILTNISEDHLGLDNVNTLEELAYVKGLVVEAVKKNGYAVLNADDPHCLGLLPNLKSQIILFSMNPDNPALAGHLDKGGIAVYPREGSLWIREGAEERLVVEINDVPATIGGNLYYNIENSMAAIAGAFGIGMSLEAIRKGLMTFQGNSKDNPGRFNMYEVNGVKVILDYGHNIDAYQKVLEGLQRLKTKNLIGVIGVPGDRTDSSTFKVGQISGSYFDKIYIKEDIDKRGRIEGDVAKVLKDGCLDSGMQESSISTILNEAEALEKAIVDAEPEDIVIVFYEELQPLICVIEKLTLAENQMAQIIA